MGSKYTIKIWGVWDVALPKYYNWHEAWRGESFVSAILALIRYKRQWKGRLFILECR